MCAPPSLNPTENKTTVATWFTCHGFGHSTDFSLGFNSKSVPGKGTDQLQLEGKDIIITKTVTALNPAWGGGSRQGGARSVPGEWARRKWQCVSPKDTSGSCQVATPTQERHKCLMFRGDPSSAP